MDFNPPPTKKMKVESDSHDDDDDDATTVCGSASEEDKDPALMLESIVGLVLSEGFLYRKDGLNIPLTCRAWSQVWKGTTLPLSATMRILPIKIAPRSVFHMPQWLTEEKKKIVNSPDFFVKVFQNVCMYRAKGKRTKKAQKAWIENMLDAKYITTAKVTVWENEVRHPFGQSGMQVELTYSHELCKASEYVWQSPWTCRLFPDFTVMTAFSKAPDRVYKKDGSPPLYP